MKILDGYECIPFIGGIVLCCIIIVIMLVQYPLSNNIVKFIICGTIFDIALLYFVMQLYKKEEPQNGT